MGYRIPGVKGFVSKEAYDKHALKTDHVNSNVNSVNNELLNLPNSFQNNLNYQSKKQRIVNDFRKPYFPGEDNIYQSNIGFATEDKSFQLPHLDSWMHYSVGIGYEATYGIADDTVKNGFEFIDDIDNEDARAVKNPTTKNMINWARRTNFLNMLWYWRAFDLGMGFGFAVGYWTAQDIKNDLMKDAPPPGPPKAFEVLNPLYLQPTGSTLTRSNRLNYDEEVWEFSGGAVNHETNIHRDRVFVLRTHEMTGRWRGLSTFDAVRYSLLGYFNNLIYIQRGIQNWGDTVAALFQGTKFPTVVEQQKIMEVLDYYEMNGKIHLPESARLEFKTVTVGKGIQSAHEIYIEDLSSMWRIPKNQLLGRSEGGGMSGAAPMISKDDYYERIGGDQIKLNYPIMKNFFWKFWPDTENYWPRWHMNVYKTDEQRLKERNMKLVNDKIKLENRKARFELRFAGKNMRDAEKNDEVPNLMANDKNKPKRPISVESEKEIERRDYIMLKPSNGGIKK